MKNETHRGSTKISMNFKNKTSSTSETNKSFSHCSLEWGFKIKHKVCQKIQKSKPKKFNKSESEVALKIMDEPRICSQINLEFKIKRENLAAKNFDRLKRMKNIKSLYLHI